jgi:hypothetical protein
VVSLQFVPSCFDRRWRPTFLQIEGRTNLENWGKSSTVGEGAEILSAVRTNTDILFIMIDQPTAIGFLITAKSILRFGEVKDSEHRRLTEYIIIGTMMSFAYAVFTSYITKMLISIFT